MSARSQPELRVDLAVPGPPHTPDDRRKAYDELVTLGGDFLQPASKRPHGTVAVCRDSSGTWLVLVHPSAWTPEDFA